MGRRKQYGAVRFEGRTTIAHKAVYVTLRGEVPDGLTLHHTCKNPLCCNPDHLELKTRSEHAHEDGHCADIQSRKTHCPHGHEYTTENTSISWKGHRCCRTCGREKNRRRREGAKEA